MTDRFFAEIEDPRERRVLEARWFRQYELTPERMFNTGAINDRDLRIVLQSTLNEAREFLAMLDAAVTMPEDEHRAMMKRLNNEPDDGDSR